MTYRITKIEDGGYRLYTLRDLVKAKYNYLIIVI